MGTAREDRGSGLGARSILTFLFHQVIALFGGPIAAASAFALVVSLLGVFGWKMYTEQYARILTEIPYFPVQVTFAFYLGWFLGVYLNHRPMIRVWIIPFGLMCLAFAALPSFGQLTPPLSELSSASRFSHFFGWGCQPKNRCFDQLFVTLPFYSALAYSMGAWIAVRLPGGHRLTDSMRAINKRRAIGMIGVPCIGLVFALSWGLYVREEALHTWWGLLTYIGGTILQGAFLASIFVVACSLAGPGSFLRSLFRDNSKKPANT
jgi:hypothetical protein